MGSVPEHARGSPVEDFVKIMHHDLGLLQDAVNNARTNRELYREDAHQRDITEQTLLLRCTNAQKNLQVSKPARAAMAKILHYRTHRTMLEPSGYGHPDVLHQG